MVRLKVGFGLALIIALLTVSMEGPCKHSKINVCVGVWVSLNLLHIEDHNKYLTNRVRTCWLGLTSSKGCLRVKT